MLSSTLAILVTIGIVLSLVFETLRFFESVSVRDFLFGTEWSPQMAMRSDQVASAGSFGAVPVFAGTLLITAIAMLVAVPIGLLSAIHMTFYASARARDVLKPLLEILVGGVLLAVSRAIGETMIVVMAAGLAANLSFNPLDAVRTVTVQIVSLLTGDQEFDSPKTLAAFALGLTLFAVTLVLNVAALRIVKRYREKYD